MESQSAVSQENSADPSPLCDVYQQLIELGFTQQTSADSPDEIQRKLDALKESAGNVTLPAHVSQWLKLLLENGHALPFFDPTDLMSHMHLNSPGLLCFCSYEWTWLEEQKLVGLIDLRSESGTVSFYFMLNDDDIHPCWDGPASRWVEFAKPSEMYLGKFTAKKKTYSALSEFFLEHINAARESQENERKRLELTQNDTCLVIEVWSKSGKGQVHHSKSAVFTPTYTNCTIAELKATVSELTGIQPDALTIKRRHMFNKFKTYCDEELLSNCGYHAGSTATVYVH